MGGWVHQQSEPQLLIAILSPSAHMADAGGPEANEFRQIILFHNVKAFVQKGVYRFLADFHFFAGSS